MTDIAKKLGFGFHEQQASREDEKQLLSVYYGVTDANFMNRLRVVVWQRDPNIIYEEDGIPNPTVLPSIATAPEHEYDAAQAKNNVIYLANRQEEQALTAQQQMEEDARRRARQEAA